MTIVQNRTEPAPLHRSPVRNAAARGMIAEQIDARAARWPRRIAFFDVDPAPSTAGAAPAALSWSELSQQSRHWSAVFPPGRLVAIAVASPTAFAGAYLAGLAAGACVAPLDPRSAPDELAAALDALGAADLLVEIGSEQHDRLETSGLRLWAASPAGLRLLAGPAHGAGRTLPGGVAEVLTTSGTTGRPKLVPLRERQLTHVADAIAASHRLTTADCGYCPLPLFHINAQVVGLLATVWAGGSLALDRRFRRSGTWEAVDDCAATWCNFVPAILSLLCDEAAPSEALARHIRFARSASAPLPVPVLERFEARTGIGVLETYGLTEAASQVAANPIERPWRRPGSVGLPVATALRVVDADGRPAAAGELGSVEIAGPGVIASYLAPDGSPIPATDPAGWFRTGDLGRFDRDGYLWLAGRSDDVINRGGELVEPREVEDVLRRHPDVADAAVVGRPHPVLGAEPVAFVVPRTHEPDVADRRRLAEELEAACAAALSRYKRPVELRVVESLPLGRTGKVARRSLVAELEQEVARHA